MASHTGKVKAQAQGKGHCEDILTGIVALLFLEHTDLDPTLLVSLAPVSKQMLQFTSEAWKKRHEIFYEARKQALLERDYVILDNSGCISYPGALARPGLELRMCDECGEPLPIRRTSCDICPPCLFFEVVDMFLCSDVYGLPELVIWRQQPGAASQPAVSLYRRSEIELVALDRYEGPANFRKRTPIPVTAIEHKHERSMRLAVVDGVLGKLDKDERLRRTYYELRPKGAYYSKEVSLHSLVLGPFLARCDSFNTDLDGEPLLGSTPFALLWSMILRYGEVVSVWSRLAESMAASSDATWVQDVVNYVQLEAGSTRKWALRMQGLVKEKSENQAPDGEAECAAWVQRKVFNAL